MTNSLSVGGSRIFSTAGTVFASLIGAPLLIFIIMGFTPGGNKDAIPYADTYIKNSDTIIIKIPRDRHKIKKDDDIFTTSGWFMGVTQTRSATCSMYYFYPPEHKKYLGAVIFKGSCNTIQRGSGEKIWYDDIEVQKLTFLYRIRSFPAYVNRRQWQSPAYGVEDNPVPIFFKHTLSERETLDIDSFIATKPSVNKRFVRLYLAHELSSKESSRLYGEGMKRLGLED